MAYKHARFYFLSVPWWTSSRLALAVLGFFGFVNVYALRVNMSVAIVCMVNQTALRLSEGNSSLNGTRRAAVSSQSCGLIPAGPSNETDDGGFQVITCIGFSIQDSQNLDRGCL